MNGKMVSVIMPAYNAEKYISQAVQSILDQTYQNLELLICDDASHDGTARIINEFADEDSRIRFFSNKTNLKLLKTRNRLLEYANGDLITFQDADDFSSPNRLEYSIAEFERNTNLGLLSCQVAYVDKFGNIIRESNKPTTYSGVLSDMHKTNVVGGSIMVIRADCLKAVGGKFRVFFEGLAYQDYDLSLLIAEKYEAYSLPDVLYYYRQHESSNSKIISTERLLSKELVLHLAKQRKERGSDDLMDGHPEKVKEYFTKLKKPYQMDRSLIYRDYAANFMYQGLNRRAIATSWKAILNRPAKLVNWMTLQYCLRKSIIK
jgi:glycosyltransferase involved in cell wall biosynthesis